MLELLGQTIVSEDDERHECSGKSPSVCTENHILYSTSLADEGDEERSSAAPCDPVCPIVDGPVLSERCLPQRIYVRAHADEVLRKVSYRLESCLKDIACLTSKEEEIEKQRKEQV